jgi:hypothetical protein
MEDVYLKNQKDEIEKIYDGNRMLTNAVYQSGCLFVDFIGDTGVFKIDFANETVTKFLDENTYIFCAADDYLFYQVNDELFCKNIDGTKSVKLTEGSPPDVIILGYYNGKFYYYDHNAIYWVAPNQQREKIADGATYMMSNKGCIVYINDGEMYKINLDTLEKEHMGKAENEYVNYLGFYNDKELYVNLGNNYLTSLNNTSEFFSLEKDLLDKNVKTKLFDSNTYKAFLNEKTGEIIDLTLQNEIQSYNILTGKQKTLDELKIAELPINCFTILENSIYYIASGNLKMYEYNTTSNEIKEIYKEAIKYQNMMP